MNIKAQRTTSFIWSLKNCNSGDTDLGKTEGMCGEEKEPGGYKDKKPGGC